MATNDRGMSHPGRPAPDPGARRPSEPWRPLPARRRNVGLLDVVARRRRFRRRRLP